ncbi:HepT-like ribonuclease domain-containing protein [Sphingomonas montanisoli]|uniref:DUF86 domain-containing protein n=1 Tax=Sphingomonas montanisoli TaxID=2606412 RepID=A0A5D9CCV8_9SPHN|nr:HepT-like ribonuclease domain-containing protein [Sphingomonas montanisoli]TZG28982.1 DUF86 domain-containing protein [Sphingomonas montanisoli]
MAADRNVDPLETMLELIAHLERRTKPLSLAQFEADQDEVDLAAFRVGHIGEEGRKLSADIRDRYPEVEWKRMVQMRNVIAHSYGTIIAPLIWNVVQTELDPIKRLCQIELERLLK